MSAHSTQATLPAPNTCQMDASCLLPFSDQIVGTCPGCGGYLCKAPQYVGGEGWKVVTFCWTGRGRGTECPGRGEG